MESLYKIRPIDHKFKGVVVASQRIGNRKALVDEANTKTENEPGYFVYNIRGPPEQLKIIRLRKVN